MDVYFKLLEKMSAALEKKRFFLNVVYSLAKNSLSNTLCLSKV